VIGRQEKMHTKRCVKEEIGYKIIRKDHYWNWFRIVDDPNLLEEYKEEFERFLDFMWDKLREYKFI
jgi:hypothetical protein